MDIKFFKKRLKNYKRKDITFTSHAEIQALMRNVDLKEVKNNITNPEKLVFVENEDSNKKKGRYGCYFAYSDYNCHKYIISLNKKIIIVTIININRNWQRIIEGKK